MQQMLKTLNACLHKHLHSCTRQSRDCNFAARVVRHGGRCRLDGRVRPLPLPTKQCSLVRLSPRRVPDNRHSTNPPQILREHMATPSDVSTPRKQAQLAVSCLPGEVNAFAVPCAYSLNMQRRQVKQVVTTMIGRLLSTGSHCAALRW